MKHNSIFFGMLSLWLVLTPISVHGLFTLTATKTKSVTWSLFDETVTGTDASTLSSTKTLLVLQETITDSMTSTISKAVIVAKTKTATHSLSMLTSGSTSLTQTSTPQLLPSSSPSKTMKETSSFQPSVSSTLSMEVTLSQYTMSLEVTDSISLGRAPELRMITPENQKVEGDDLRDSHAVHDRTIIVQVDYAKLNNFEKSVTENNCVRISDPSNIFSSYSDTQGLSVKMNFESQTISIQLPFVPTYKRFDDLDFYLLFSSLCFAPERNPERGNLSVTVKRATSPTVLDEKAKQAIFLTSSSSATLASIGAAPTAVRANALVAMQLMSECNEHLLKDGSTNLPILMHPTRISFGSPAELGYFVAAAIMNHVLVFSTLILHGMTTFLLAKKNKAAFVEQAAKLKFPSASFAVVMLLFEPTAMGCFVLLYFGVLTQKIIAAISLLFCLGEAMMLIGLVTSFFEAKWKEREYTNKEHKPASIVTFLIGSGRWVEKKKNWSKTSSTFFVDRFGSLFFHYRHGRQWFCTVEILLTFATGAVFALLPSPGQCAEQSIAFLIITVLELLSHFILVPHFGMWNRWCWRLMLVVQSLGVLFSVLHHTGASGAWTIDADAVCLIILTILLGLQFLVNFLSFLFRRKVYGRYETQKEKDRQVYAMEGGKKASRSVTKGSNGTSSSSADDEEGKLLQRALQKATSSHASATSKLTRSKKMRELLNVLLQADDGSSSDNKELEERRNLPVSRNPLHQQHPDHNRSPAFIPQQQAFNSYAATTWVDNDEHLLSSMNRDGAQSVHHQGSAGTCWNGPVDERYYSSRSRPLHEI